MIGVLSLDLFCEWRKRIIDNNGYVDSYLTKAVILPAAITALQAAYFLPKLNYRAERVEKGKASSEELEHENSSPSSPCLHWFGGSQDYWLSGGWFAIWKDADDLMAYHVQRVARHLYCPFFFHEKVL